MDITLFCQENTPRPLILYPSSILTIPTKYSNASIYHRTLASRILLSIMYSKGGVGLAAPQVNLEDSIFVMNSLGDHKLSHKEKVVINPKLISISEKQVRLDELCLSLPRCRVNIKRPKSIAVEYETIQGELKKEILDGSDCRVFLHEYDHLLGKLTLDYIGLESQI
jgi:peptide deformylase